MAAAIRWPRWLPLAVILVLGAICTIGAVVTIRNLQDDRHSYSHLLRSNAWMAGQIELEAYRFAHVLDRYRLGDVTVAPEEVLRRFDLLWSRLPVALNGVEAAQLREIAGAVAQLQALLDWLEHIDPVVQKLEQSDRAELARIATEATDHAERAHELALAMHIGGGRGPIRQRLDENHQETMIAVGFLVAAGSLIVVILQYAYGHSAAAARRERELRAKADAANLAKSQFLANMSHELRTPLNAISGFAQIMDQELLGQLGQPRYREYARDIGASAQHLLGIISDLLDMSRVEIGELKLEESVFDLCEQVRHSLIFLQPTVQQRAIRIETILEPESISFRGDARLVRQIVINLVSNAAKFSENGGSVTVSVRKAASGVALHVSDRGAGISRDELQGLGRPFVRGSNARKSAEGGSGLGLALVRAFAEAHGGRLELRSELGRGTTASIQFPLARCVVVADPSRLPGPASLRTVATGQDAVSIHAHATQGARVASKIS